MHWLWWSLHNYILGISHFLLSLPSWGRHTPQERHNPVTRLSASLLTPWLFPDKCSCPLDSMSLSSRVMANYQEAVCWKDAARNYICLQTALRSKHMLWNKLPLDIKWIHKNQKLPSEHHVTEKCLSYDWHENWDFFLFFSTSYCLHGWNVEKLDESL